MASHSVYQVVWEMTEKNTDKTHICQFFNTHLGINKLKTTETAIEKQVLIFVIMMLGKKKQQLTP